MSTKTHTGRATFLVHGESVPIVGTWSGGAYIDLHWYSASGTAFEVINIWDYATGKATEDPSQRGTIRRLIREWHAELGATKIERRDELANYMRNTQ